MQTELMHTLPRQGALAPFDERAGRGGPGGDWAEPSGAMPAPGRQAAASLVEVLWRRRRTVGISVLAAVVLTSMYLLMATRIYRSTSTLFIDQEEPTVFTERQIPVNRTDERLNTQVEILRSV